MNIDLSNGNSGYNTYDLIAMLLGLRTLKTEPGGGDGQAYWTDGGLGRDLQWNLDWFKDPEAAWNAVEYRDWLAAAVLLNRVEFENPYTALPLPAGDGDTICFDLLAMNVVPLADPTAEPPDVLNDELTKPKGGHERCFSSALTAGLILTEANTLVLGLGLRRTTTVCQGTYKAPRADGKEANPGALSFHHELFVPCLALRDKQLAAVTDDALNLPEEVRSVYAGIAVTRHGAGGNLGTGDLAKYSGIRCHARIPMKHDGESLTFEAAKTGVQTQADADANWEDFTGGVKALVDLLVKKPNAVVALSKDLLAAPFSPVTGFPKARAQKTLQDRLDQLKKLSSASQKLKQKDAKEPKAPESSDNNVFDGLAVGSFLHAVGLLEGNDTTQDYHAPAAKPSLETVAVKAIASIDGFPLFAKKAPGRKGLFKQLLELARGQSKPAAVKTRVLQLASRGDESDDKRTYFGVRAQAPDWPLKKPKPREQTAEPAHQGDQPPVKRELEVLMQLGKWFSPETDADNWYNRLVYLKTGKKPASAPGIGLYPLAIDDAGGDKTLGMHWRADFVSVGFDVDGTNEAGLIDLPRLHVGGAEARLLLALDFNGPNPDVTWGAGAMLTGVRLNLGPMDNQGKKQTGKPPQNMEGEVLALMQTLFKEPGTDAPPATPAKSPRRIFGPPDSLFSVSVGYLQGAEVDVQLYDALGRRGGIVWLPVERSLKFLHLQAIGIGLKGEGTSGRELTLVANGDVRFGPLTLGLIGAGVRFPLASPKDVKPVLMGLDVAVKRGSVEIAGGIMKMEIAGETQYVGELRIDVPSFTLAAMGAYGKIPVGTSGDKALSMFGYGAFCAKNGGGIGNAIVKITGLALGFGVNRRVVIPPIDRVEDFSMVEMVMGDGAGAAEADAEAKKSLPATLQNSGSKLYRLVTEELVAAPGHYFGCLGLRLLLAEVLDCFLLAVVQVAKDDLEVTLLGLGRMQEPRKGKPICKIEVAIKVDVRPLEGAFVAQAALTRNSWVLNESCRLTGGYAVAFWTLGEHRGDFVYTQGGYHPDFERPAHYPSVPRMGLSWQPTGDLTIRGGLYYAVTPTVFMAGGRLEASFNSGPISAWFDAWADMLIRWRPFEYSVGVGITIRVEIHLLFTLHFDLGVDLQLHGQPSGGTAHVHISGHSFTISWGSGSPEPAKITSWQEFGKTFLDTLGDDGKKIDPKKHSTKWDELAGEGPNVTRLDLAAGSVAGQHGKRPAGEKRWFVRGDELEIGVATVIPVKTLNTSKLKTVPEVESDRPQVLESGLSMGSESEKKVHEGKLGLAAVDGTPELTTSCLNLALVQENEDGKWLAADPLELWTPETDCSAMPRALWSTDEISISEPPAETTIPDCVTGVGGLRPPIGGLWKQGAPQPPKLTRKTLQQDEDHLTPADTPTAGVTALAAPQRAEVAVDTAVNVPAAAKVRGATRGALVEAGFLAPDTGPEERWHTLSWEELAGKGVQGALGTLGWTKDSWASYVKETPAAAWNAGLTPPAYRKHWRQLEPEKLEAAKKLGYDGYTWEQRFTAADLARKQLTMRELYVTRPLERSMP